MKRKVNEMYDRVAAGRRIQAKRELLGLSQETVAEQIDRASKYVSDIERGKCGASLETMIAFANLLDMSIDFIIYGDNSSDKDEQEDAALAMIELISKRSKSQREQAIQLLQVYFNGIELVKNELLQDTEK